MTDKNTIVKSILINAPYEMVSGYAGDNKNWCNWNSSFSGFHYLSGSGDVGSKFEMNLSIAGMLYENICQIDNIERTPDSLMEKDIFTTKNLTVPEKMSTGYTIESIKRTQNGSEVTLKQHFDDIDDPIALALVANSMVFALTNLKLMMEGPPASSVSDELEI